MMRRLRNDLPRNARKLLPSNSKIFLDRVSSDLSHRARAERAFPGTGRCNHPRGITGRYRPRNHPIVARWHWLRTGGSSQRRRIWFDKDFTTALQLTIFLAIVGLLDNVLKPLVIGAA